ncbi:MAG: hypothetical protein ACXW5U_13675 [Thermoanaerobaculia bacterium]
MRKTLTLSLLLFCNGSLFAADGPADRWRISVLASEISIGGRDSFAGSDAWSDDPHAGIGLGVAYVPAPRWDVEFTVASQRHRSPYTRLFYSPMPNGQPGFIYPVTEFREYRVNPVDLSVTRHFLTDRTIAPYLRTGVRYVRAPEDPMPVSTIVPYTGDIPLVPVREGYGFSDRVSAQAGAGVRVRLTPRTAIRAEATRLLRSEETDFDPLTRYAVGLSWVF